MSLPVATTNTPRLLLLHPGQEGAEDALGRAGVVRAALRERLLHLVDPQDDRRHRLGGARRALEVLFALAEVLVVEVARVEPDQRQLPLAARSPWRTCSCRSPARRSAGCRAAGSARTVWRAAGSVNASLRLASHSLRLARPATSDMRSSAAKYSSTPERSTISFLASAMRGMSSAVNMPSSTTTLVRIFFTSNSVSPCRWLSRRATSSPLSLTLTGIRRARSASSWRTKS